MEKITLTQSVMKMFSIQTARFVFLTAPGYGIIFKKKKYFLQNDSISIEEVKKPKPTKLNKNLWTGKGNCVVFQIAPASLFL